MTVLDPESVFYGDVQEAVASEAVAALLPHSKLAFTSECGMPAWAEPSYSGRSAYIRCSDDKAIPMAVQDSLLSASGVAWEVHTVASGRSPFLSCPADVAEYIVSFFNKIGASM